MGSEVLSLSHSGALFELLVLDQEVPGFSHTFPALALESAISPMNSDSLLLENGLSKPRFGHKVYSGIMGFCCF